MEWTKIPTDLIQSRFSDKEILAITKFQLVWAMLEREPTEEICLRYMTKNQYQQAVNYLSSIQHRINADIKSVEGHRKRQKIFYQKNQTLMEKTDSQSDSHTDSQSDSHTDATDKIRLDKKEKERNQNNQKNQNDSLKDIEPKIAPKIAPNITPIAENEFPEDDRNDSRWTDLDRWRKGWVDKTKFRLAYCGLVPIDWQPTEKDYEETQGCPFDYGRLTTRYAFEGKVIKVNHEDLKKWCKKYPDVAVEHELNGLDLWFQDAKQAKNRKNWFFMTEKILAKKQIEYANRAGRRSYY